MSARCVKPATGAGFRLMAREIWPPPPVEPNAVHVAAERSVAGGNGVRAKDVKRSSRPFLAAAGADPLEWTEGARARRYSGKKP